jgi:hypothetical protein
MDNWQDIYGCFGDSEEALSTRCVGLGVVVFYGMAKLARTPQGRTEEWPVHALDEWQTRVALCGMK